jgi:hypothetical protein
VKSIGVPSSFDELIGGDFLPATGSLQAYFMNAPQRTGSIRGEAHPMDLSRIDTEAFKP